MDLVATVRKEGSRGGRGDFKWSDVQGDQHRENYLGHSLMAPVGRWQKNRDLSWYAKGDEAALSAEDAATAARKEHEAEIRRIKEAEQEAFAKALGLPVAALVGGEGEGTGANGVTISGGRIPGVIEAGKEAEGDGDWKAEKEARRAERRLRREKRRERSGDRERESERRHRYRYRNDDADGERRHHDRRHHHSRDRAVSYERRRHHHDLPRSKPRSRTRSRSPRHERKYDVEVHNPKRTNGPPARPHSRPRRSRSRSYERRRPAHLSPGLARHDVDRTRPERKPRRSRSRSRSVDRHRRHQEPARRREDGARGGGL